MKRLKELIRLDFMLSNVFKSNCTFLLTLIAIAMFIINPTREQKFCMYAILVSTFADLVLMNYKNIPAFIFGNKYFYFGMAAFAITHIIYISCFSNIVIQKGMSLDNANIALLFAIIIVVFTFYVLIELTKQKSVIFQLASLGYTMVLSLSLVAIYICADLIGKSFILAAIGITMFLASDLMILYRETVKDTNLVRKLIWIFYPIGQILIIFGVYF